MPGFRLDARPVLLLVAVLSFPGQSPQITARAQTAGPLLAKEVLSYDVEWRLVEAGKAKLVWTPSSQLSRPGWQVNLHLESAGLVSKLYRVNDDYGADLNSDFCVQDTHLQAREGGRQRETAVHFDSSAKKANYLERDLVKHSAMSLESDIPACVHDVIGGLFFLRTRNFELGKSVEVPVSDGKKAVFAKVQAQQR